MLNLTTTDNRTQFEPGEQFEVIAGWQLPASPVDGELRLLWETSGKGTTEDSLVAMSFFRATSTSGSQRFKVTLPSAPYSFSGKLVSLTWYLELEFESVSEQTRIEIVVAPMATEILLEKPLAERSA